MTKSSPLLRSLGLFDATMLVIGCIVGVGIFRTASAIALNVPSPGLILWLWVAGGVVSLCGALCYAELAGMFPASGGDYVYITQVYGRFWGFLFGWTKLFIERTGTIAILGFVFAEYVRRVLGFDEPALRWVASGAILALTAVNIAGIRWGKYVQNALTVLKIVALASLAAAGAWIATHHPNSVDWSVPPLTAAGSSLGVAFVFVLWTYGGWTEAAYVAEEVRQPTRNVPRAIIIGVLLTTALYVLVNWAYLIAIPIEELDGSPLVASTVMQRALGEGGAVFIAWMIAASAFGALNGYILTGGRILYALGKDHPLFGELSAVHPKFRTPAVALVANAAIAIGLVFTKTLDQIMTYSQVIISLFFTMAVFAVIFLRREQPHAARPYRAWGYPVTPLLFCVSMLWFMADVCAKQPDEAAFGLVLLAVGIPLYRWSQRSRRRQTA
jgi:amino acid transporter